MSSFIKNSAKKVICDICNRGSIWVESSYIGAPDQWFQMKMEIDPSRNDRHIENYVWDVCPRCIDPDMKTMWGRFVHRWKYIRGRSKWIRRKRPVGECPKCDEPFELCPCGPGELPAKPAPTPEPSDGDLIEPCPPFNKGFFRRWRERRKARRG